LIYISSIWISVHRLVNETDFYKAKYGKLIFKTILNVFSQMLVLMTFFTNTGRLANSVT